MVLSTLVYVVRLFGRCLTLPARSSGAHVQGSAFDALWLSRLNDGRTGEADCAGTVTGNTLAAERGLVTALSDWR